MSALKRLQKTMAKLKKKPPAYWTGGPLDGDDILKWQVVFDGPEGTPYEGGKFKLNISFPAEYPFKYPNLQFVTKVYHPNIQEDGIVCYPLLSDDNWTPTYNLFKIVDWMRDLMQNPGQGDPLRADLHALLTDNPKEFAKKAREATKQHARG